MLFRITAPLPDGSTFVLSTTADVGAFELHLQQLYLYYKARRRRGQGEITQVFEWQVSVNCHVVCHAKAALRPALFECSLPIRQSLRVTPRAAMFFCDEVIVLNRRVHACPYMTNVPALLFACLIHRYPEWSLTHHVSPLTAVVLVSKSSRLIGGPHAVTWPGAIRFVRFSSSSRTTDAVSIFAISPAVLVVSSAWAWYNVSVSFRGWMESVSPCKVAAVILFLAHSPFRTPG